MPVEAACPSCEGKFRLPDAAAGKKIRCPKCKGPLDVPPLGAEPPAAEPVVAPPAKIVVPSPPPPAAPAKPFAPANPPAENLKATWRNASQEPAPPDPPRAEAPKAAPTTKPTPTRPTPPSPPEAPKKQAPIFVPPAAADTSPPTFKPKPESAKPTPPELWFMKGEDGETFGPVDRPTLNSWHDEGRMTADSQLLKHGTEQWQWASDLYPDLEEPEPEPTPPAVTIANEPVDSVQAVPLQKKTRASQAADEVAGDDDDADDTNLSPHSKPIAVLLGLTLGMFGIHRFYLGYVGLGLAMFFTFGGLLMWSITDSLRILFGHVTDSEGKKLRD